MPPPSTYRTCTPIPCQSASNSLCGFSRLAMPERDLQGRSFRNGVRFSVQTCSDGRVPCRNWYSDDRGRSPSGRNVSEGDDVRCSSIDPSDAQNNPAKLLRSPRHRSSTLRVRQLIPEPARALSTHLAREPSAIHAHSSAPVPTPSSSGWPQLS
jgi:hypothetical protein